MDRKSWQKECRYCTAGRDGRNRFTIYGRGTQGMLGNGWGMVKEAIGIKADARGTCLRKDQALRLKEQDISNDKLLSEEADSC
ncbi:hypothetical protein M3J09_001852 [Ascochyta lentis]